MSSDTPLTSLDNLRFWLSGNISGEAWIEVEPFFDAIETELAEARQQLAYMTDDYLRRNKDAVDWAEEIISLRQQIVARDALVEGMRKALHGSVGCFTEGSYREVLHDSQHFINQALALTPSTALAEHDVEVRRKVLEEAAAYLERDDFYNSSGMAAETVLRRMANA